MRQHLTESFVERSANLNISMIYVKGGVFSMGSDGNESRSNEKPVHMVSVSDFFVSQYPITQVQWKTIMGSNPSKFKKKSDADNRPIDYVSWDDCMMFIKKLNKLTEKNYRLLTEAEWEYAARGGGISKDKYSGSRYIKEVAWFDEVDGSTHPVGQKQPNALGIYDMSGNVWEWCHDFFATYEAEFLQDPRGPKFGVRHVCRGGSWEDIADNCRVASRYSYPATYHGKTLGLRLAL